MPVVLYGCEAWSLMSREERRLRVFENWTLRRIFRSKSECRMLQNEKLHSLCRLPNIFRVIKSRRLRWAGHVARMNEDMSALIILTGTPTVNRPLGRPGLR